MFSLAFHAVVFYLIYHARWSYKVFDFKEKRTDVLLVPSPRIRFGPAQPAGGTGTLSEKAGGQAAGGAAAPPGKKPGTPPAGTPGEEAEERPGFPGTGAAAGTAGGGGLAGGDPASSFSRGFSLVYPADAMINLAKYAGTPEDALLRPYRPARKDINFSTYVYPQAGRRGAVAGPGGPGGRFEPAKPGGGGSGVMASVPENVRTYDLTAWANEVLARIQRYWMLGREVEAEAAGQVGIQVHMMKAGDLTMIEIIDPTKVEVLDAAARDAIARAAPFPPLPEDFPFSSLEIYFVFRYGR
ncbi:MAG: TonB family protein [Candidatus Aminicenantes bacterium]|nr:TonB family protein [Candidatus Aminicenantes bacterium]